MAGEAQPNLTYNDISSGKVVNKEGLLELSKNIKEYVAENVGGGSSSSQQFETLTISSTVAYGGQLSATVLSRIDDAVKNWFLSYVDENGNINQDLYKKTGIINLSDRLQYWVVCEVYPSVELLEDVSTANYYGHTVSCFIYQCATRPNKDSANYNIGLPYLYYLEIYKNGSNWYIAHGQKNYCNYLLPYSNKNTVGDEVPIFLQRIMKSNGNMSATSIDSWITATELKTALSLSTVATSGSYNDLTDKPTIPSLPTDPSSDGDYVLQNTISSGTSTLSWGTPSSGGGGGTTYTAGTGISIINGVISLDLANASQEVM